MYSDKCILGEDIKKKWKNLRDAYSKHIRTEKTRTGQKAKSIDRYKTWPWAQQMSFFKSFLQFANTESNVDSLETTSHLQEAETQHSIYSSARSQSSLESASAIPTATETSVEEPEITDTATSQTPRVVKKRRCDKKPEISSIDKVLSYLEKKQSNVQTSHDEIDLLFMGYAATVKKFSRKQQILVKHKIATIIMEAELLEQEADGNATPLSRPESNLSASNPNPSCPSSSATIYSLSPTLISPEMSQNSVWSLERNNKNPTTRWYEGFSGNVLFENNN